MSNQTMLACKNCGSKEFLINRKNMQKLRVGVSDDENREITNVDVVRDHGAEEFLSNYQCAECDCQFEKDELVVVDEEIDGLASKIRKLFV